MRTIKQIEADIISALNIDAKPGRQADPKEIALQSLLNERTAALSSKLISKKIDSVMVQGSMDGRRFIPAALGAWGDDGEKKMIKALKMHSSEVKPRRTGAYLMLADKFGEVSMPEIIKTIRVLLDTERAKKKHGYIKSVLKILKDEQGIEITEKQINSLIK